MMPDGALGWLERQAHLPGWWATRGRLSPSP
jgi:hypothetical protein